jgi:hypothetical protein
MMKAFLSFKISGTVYPITQSIIPEDFHLQHSSAISTYNPNFMFINKNEHHRYLAE